MKKLIYPITAIICCLILGVSFYLIQTNKQQSIERQKQMDINRDEAAKQEAEAKERSANASYNLCVSQADDAYWAYVKLNGTEKDDGTVTAAERVWDRAEENKQNEIDNCYKQYK